MTKQPELPDFYRDLEIVQSLNRASNPPIDSGEHRDLTEIEPIQDGSNT
jgi:hypothetical protein